MNNFDFNSPKNIVCGPGSLARVGPLLVDAQFEKVLVVTDKGIVDAGLLARLTELLTSSNIEYDVFDAIVADPPEKVVNEAVELATRSKVQAIIGFGGGSSLDSAKLVALLANSEQTLNEIYGVDQARSERLPLFLIPTTAGTGSEATAVAIVTTGSSTKAGVVSTKLLPDVAILDAQLTLGLPAHITAATGIDAMVHAIEAYTSKLKKNPMSDSAAKLALDLLSKNIVRATYSPDDIDARSNMLLGACLAGQAFANAPVAAVHALAYPLGGHFHIPHGLSNSLVLPEVLRFNLPSCTSLYAELGHYIEGVDTAGSDERVAQAMIERITILIEELQLPRSLREVGVTEASLEQLASDAMQQQRLLVNNPRNVTYDDALAIYQRVF